MRYQRLPRALRCAVEEAVGGYRGPRRGSRGLRSFTGSGMFCAHAFGVKTEKRSTVSKVDVHGKTWRKILSSFSPMSPLFLAPCPSKEAIAEYAYEKFLARESENGHDLEDWLAAERELTAAVRL